VCSTGQCSFQCGGGTIQCGSKCVDPLTDPANCGSCQNGCPTGEVCSLGQCGLLCGGGTTQCGVKCVDTQFDPANCSGCNITCSVGQVGSKGSCGGLCGGALVMCGNTCVDTQTDPSNCGTCGTVCAPGTSCVSGKCYQCNSATTDCDKDGWLASEGDCCDKGTSLFSVCETQTANPSCWDPDVSAASCSLGLAQLAGTGFETSGSCLIGGGTYWLTTTGNVTPGQVVEIRIAI